MIKLFKRDGYEIKVEPEALLLKPFKKIWNRDRSKDKNRAMQELGFIYFVCDPRSDYQYLVDLDTRMESVKQGEGLPNDWTPDQTVKEAMEFYSSFKPTSALLLEDTRVAVDKLREHLKNMDFNEVDDKGKPINVVARDRGVSEMIIEDFMLAANETVALTLYQMQFKV